MSGVTGGYREGHELIRYGEDDQIVLYQITALKAVELLKNRTLKTYSGFPPTEAETSNMLEFISR